MNFTMSLYWYEPTPCIEDMYLEVRDGSNQSANLLGVFCGTYFAGIVRSSGQNMWLRKTYYFFYRFRGSYTNKTANITVVPNLNQVAETQFVVFNHSSSLWCPAQGAPAPFIVWKKNGIVLQNSTSVRYQLTVTEESNDKYSCEVDTENGLEKKEINVIIKSRCPDQCKCNFFLGTSLLRVKCKRKQLLSKTQKFPLATVKLDLSQNQINYLPGDVFSNNAKLRVLNLSSNQLEDLPPGAFSNNTELQTLYLYSNQLKELPSGLFSNNTKLQILDLYNNQLKELPPGVFSNNIGLRGLALNSNQLNELPPGLFSNNTELEWLILSSNQLNELPPGLFSNNTELGWLWLNSNQLKELPPRLFSNNTELQELRLESNQLKELPPGLFSNNTELLWLHLDSNQIKELPPRLFSNNTELDALYLSSNQLKELPPGLFSNNTELEWLGLASNQLKELPPGLFSNNTELVWLDLSNNEVRRLPQGLFTNLTRLKKLFLPNNQIEDLPPEIFANLTSIETLKLDKNNIKKLHGNQFHGLDKLFDLYLSENKIQYLPQEIFKGLKNLKSLNIFDNRLRSVSTDTFNYVPELQMLYMHYNEMNDLPKGFFTKLTQIMRVSLDTNLMCCHLHKEDADCDFTFNDIFARCERMVSSSAPRKSIWVIGIFSLVGAVFVVIWRTIFKEKKIMNIVQSIMLLHLAVSDGLMSVYLMIVGIRDLQWSGEYYLYDFQWRTGQFCQVTGALCLLSSEVSVMTMSLLSADRLKNIVFPYHGSNLTPKMTHILCFFIWGLGFFIAFFPMSGIHYFNDPGMSKTYYGRSVVCLPLQLSRNKPAGWEYSVAIFVVLNLVFVVFVMVAYLMILLKTYLSSWRLARQGTAREIQARAQTANFKRETALAKRVFFIILTDCLCWMPVVVIGLRSIIEKSFRTPGDLSVWIAVFVLPLNSALNPILYTLSTQQVRDILGNKMARMWNYLKRTFFCYAQNEEEGGEGEQNPQGIEDNEQLDGEQGGAGEVIEMQAVAPVPLPEQEERGDGEQNPQGIEGNQHFDGQEGEPVGAVGLQAAGVTHSLRGGMRKRSSKRRALSVRLAKNSQADEKGDSRSQVSIQKEKSQADEKGDSHSQVSIQKENSQAEEKDDSHSQVSIQKEKSQSEKLDIAKSEPLITDEASSHRSTHEKEMIVYETAL